MTRLAVPCLIETVLQLLVVVRRVDIDRMLGSLQSESGIPLAAPLSGEIPEGVVLVFTM